MYDYPDGRPDTLTLHRTGEQPSAFHVRHALDPGRVPGPHGGPDGRRRDRPGADHVRPRQPGHAGASSSARIGPRPSDASIPTPRSHDRSHHDLLDAPPDLRGPGDGGGLVRDRHRRRLAPDGGSTVAGQAEVGDLDPAWARRDRRRVHARLHRHPGALGRHGQRGLPDPGPRPPDLRPGCPTGRRASSTTAPRRRTSWTPGSRSSCAATLDRLDTRGRGAGRCASRPGGAARGARDGRPHPRPAGGAHDARARSSRSSCARRRGCARTSRRCGRRCAS